MTKTWRLCKIISPETEYPSRGTEGIEIEDVVVRVRRPSTLSLRVPMQSGRSNLETLNNDK